jgi:hypothetical protein
VLVIRISGLGTVALVAEELIPRHLDTLNNPDDSFGNAAGQIHLAAGGKPVS